jgi:hypothetical protein
VRDFLLLLGVFVLLIGFDFVGAKLERIAIALEEQDQ